MTRTVIDGAYIATVDAMGTEHARGHVVIDGTRIVAVGAGPAPADLAAGAARVDGSGHLLTPGLVNTHHHLYQWLTRGWAQDAILFDWLSALYPTWSRIDADLVRDGAAAAMAVLARSGCSTVADHHYIFPHDSGDIIGAIVEAAGDVGLRLHAARGSMDLGESDGGLPPDFAIETTHGALDATADAVARFHDPGFDSMVRIAVAPCAPFTVTQELLRESATLARQLGVRMHTHGSETIEEESFCRERFGMTPTEYLDAHGWLGDDVWMAHCVHLDENAIAQFAVTGTGVAHCPSSNARLAAGTAPVPELLAAGVPVGLGVDGAASNESGQLGTELRNALLVNRLRSGADRLSTRQALQLGTIGGARVLGRDAEIGSIEPGKLADLALWRIDRVEHAGILDPVAALTLGSLPPLTRLFVNGEVVVENGELAKADGADLARAAASASAELRGR